MGQGEVTALTEAMLLASRVFVAVAVSSLADVSDDVTLAQFRVLVILSTRGTQSLASLAEVLDVNPSTATRLCDRLVVKKLIRRTTARADRREVRLATTAAGTQLVRRVTDRRRARIGRLLQRIPEEHRAHLVDGLAALAAAAGDVPEQPWSLGWTKGAVS
jgi:DNA-binding MarR family transcriptional regulator